MFEIEHDYAFEPKRLKPYSSPRASKTQLARMGETFQLGKIIRETGMLSAVNSMVLARDILQHPESRWGHRFHPPVARTNLWLLLGFTASTGLAVAAWLGLITLQPFLIVASNACLLLATVSSSSTKFKWPWQRNPDL